MTCYDNIATNMTYNLLQWGYSTSYINVSLTVWPTHQNQWFMISWSERFTARLLQSEITRYSQGLIKDLGRNSQRPAAVTSKEGTHGAATVNSRDNKLCFYHSLISAAPCGFDAPQLKRPQTFKCFIIAPVYCKVSDSVVSFCGQWKTGTCFFFLYQRAALK